MKYFYSMLLGLLLAFNVQAEFSPIEQNVADMLLSGDDKQLKIAAKSIASKKMSNPELVDILAEVLLKKYPNAYPSEVDTLAWMARAIGASKNGRYHSMLSEVLTSTKHRKLTRHIDKALDELGDAEGEQYIAGMYKLPEGLYARESDEARDKRVMALLMAGDLRSLKEGTRTIIDSKSQNQALTDTVAEILISYHADALDSQIETFAWMTKALAQSKSGRYVEVLAAVKAKGAHRKLRKHASKSLQQHGVAKGEQYQKGMLGKAIPTYDL